MDTMVASETAVAQDKTYSTREIARMFNVSRMTLYTWEKKGIVSPKRDFRGWREFTEKDREVIYRLTKAGARTYGDYLKTLKELSHTHDNGTQAPPPDAGAEQSPTA